MRLASRMRYNKSNIFFIVSWLALVSFMRVDACEISTLEKNLIKHEITDAEISKILLSENKIYRNVGVKYIIQKLTKNNSRECDLVRKYNYFLEDKHKSIRWEWMNFLSKKETDNFCLFYQDVYPVIFDKDNEVRYLAVNYILSYTSFSFALEYYFELIQSAHATDRILALKIINSNRISTSKEIINSLKSELVLEYRALIENGTEQEKAAAALSLSILKDYLYFNKIKKLLNDNSKTFHEPYSCRFPHNYPSPLTYTEFIYNGYCTNKFEYNYYILQALFNYRKSEIDWVWEVFEKNEYLSDELKDIIIQNLIYYQPEKINLNKIISIYNREKSYEFKAKWLLLMLELNLEMLNTSNFNLDDKLQKIIEFEIKSNKNIQFATVISMKHRWNQYKETYMNSFFKLSSRSQNEFLNRILINEDAEILNQLENKFISLKSNDEFNCEYFYGLLLEIKEKITK